MPLSLVVKLEALEDGALDSFTGRGVHGFWFNAWRAVDPAMGDRLHQDSQEAPFTLSPLMGLPAPRGGTLRVQAGTPAWFRVTALTEELEQALLERWLTALPVGSQARIPAGREVQEQQFGGLLWQVSGHALHPADRDGLVAQEDSLALARRTLMTAVPPHQWRLEFLTPTTFHGKTAHLPFPLPDSLVGSWMRRWQAFAPLALPDELPEWARSSLAVSAFNLQTRPAREGSRLRVGCVGWLTLRALEMPPYLRACIDLLAQYALYCGSGSHTTQGMGQTRLVGRE